jgi:hypothetical protein
MLNLNTEILGRLPGVLPETDEQTNIASMLDALGSVNLSRDGT